MRTYGEVLTFGSGDCGQLAHGIDNDEDLMVKYPRVVYSLRCNILSPCIERKCISSDCNYGSKTGTRRSVA